MKHYINDTTYKKRTSGRIIILLLVLLLVIFLAAELVYSNQAITVAEYSFDSPKISESVRIAVVTDTHCKEFWGGNQRLYSKIKEQDPDIILAVGDLIESKVEIPNDTEYLETLLSNLCDIAPVYCSLGNHEKNSPKLEEYVAVIEKSDATLLEGNYLDIEINDTPIRIGGLSYYRKWDTETNTYLTEYTDTEDFTLLLCHQPELYLWGIDEYPVDLTVSGHTHGGMIQIPFVGAVYVPDQETFPDYAEGFFQMDNGYLAISTGLGSSPYYLQRMFNPPQIISIEVQ